MLAVPLKERFWRVYVDEIGRCRGRVDGARDKYPSATPQELAQRLTMLGLAVEAMKWRETVAHGVSRGLGVSGGTSPVEAAEKSRAFGAGFLSPLQGFCNSAPATHGLRRGLPSVAASRLFPVFFAFAFLTLLPQANAAAPFLKTQNVFLIISDGFRWQEVFNGAEAQLMTKENGGVKDTNALRAQFWRDTPEARRGNQSIARDA